MILVDLNKRAKLSCVLLLLSVSLTGCQKAEEKANERLKLGAELFKQGDYKKAELELKSAIQADGSVAGSYYYMALLNEKDGQFKAMKENLAQAVALDPGNVDAHLKYGKVLLIFNEADKALSQALEALKLASDNVEALSLKAAALIKQKNTAEAMPIIDGMLQKNPQYSPASALKVVVLMENKAFDQALALVESAIQLDRGNLELHLLKIQIDSKRKDVAAIIKDYERLIELVPDNDEIKIALAKIYILAKRNNDADTLLNEMVTAHPDKIETKLLHLEFLNTVDKSKAAAQLQTYIAESKNNPTLLFAISQWLLGTQQYDAAQTVLESNLPNKQLPEIAQKMKLLLVELKYYKGDYEGALRLVDEVLAENSTNQQAKILKAKIYVVKKDYEPAIDLFNKVLWESPELDGVVVMLGEIELLKRNPDKADKKFREALEINPANLDALRPVIQRALRQANNSYVDELVTKALQFKPDDVTLAEQLVRIKIAEKDWEVAKNALESLEKNPNAQELVLFLRAKIDQEQDLCPQAMSGYKNLLVQTPSYSEALYSMTQCAEKLHQRNENIAYLTGFISQNPSIIPAYLIKSRLYALNKNDSEALAALKQALGVDKHNAAIYSGFAMFYLDGNDAKSAVRYYQEGLKNVPDNEGLQLGLAQAYEKSNDFDNAALIYEQVIAKNPNSDVAYNNLATVLIDHYTDEKSVARAKAIVARFQNSEQAYFLDTYGWVEAKTGDINKAIVILEKVNVMASQVAVFKYHLGVAYYKQGNNAGAAAQLQEALLLGTQHGQFVEEKQARQLLDKIKLTK
ncbi:MAG: tetratricopeptide repeat protein [Methylococcales bacterium]